jgi:hypothetical protein
LRKTLSQEDVLNANNHNIRELLKKLCFIPLAIVQASAYITMNNISIPSYLSLLDDTKESLVKILSEDFEDNKRYQD